MELKEVKQNSATQKNKKGRRNKMRTALAVIIVLLILTLVVGVLCFTLLFPIKNITVEGNTIYSSDQIISASEIKAGDKLFSVFTEPVNSRLTKNLPYIKSIKLDKKLPDTLKIKVTETKETFAFCSENTYFITDENYKILRETAELPENVALLTIPEKFEFPKGQVLDGETKSLKLITDIYNMLGHENISVNAVEISEYDYITVKILGRFTVSFGTKENIDGKISHLKGMVSEIDKKNGSGCKGKIDLTSWSNEKREGYFELTAN